MSSVKCPYCGLVNFSAAGTCKRCQKELGATADSTGVPRPAAHANQSSPRPQSSYPLLSWLLTLLLLITNASLAYAVSRKAAAEPAEVLGMTTGGMIAWPLIFLIAYALSRKLRERHSLHAVINYGLGLNAIVQSFMSLR